MVARGVGGGVSGEDASNGDDASDDGGGGCWR